MHEMWHRPAQKWSLEIYRHFPDPFCEVSPSCSWPHHIWFLIFDFYSGHLCDTTLIWKCWVKANNNRVMTVWPGLDPRPPGCNRSTYQSIFFHFEVLQHNISLWETERLNQIWLKDCVTFQQPSQPKNEANRPINNKRAFIIGAMHKLCI